MNIENLNRARNAALAFMLATGLSLPTAGLAYAADGDAGDNATPEIKDRMKNLINEDAEDETQPKKTESVYVFSNPDGSVKNTVVTDWLKNPQSASTLEDVSSLTDIENTEGKETFTNDSGRLVWEAAGNDIYYQGNTDKEAPVELKVTYWLDGKQIAPADLAGKSGHVKIRFDYTNKSSSTELVAGAARTVYTPFVCVTGMILDNGVFKNITTENAKSMNDGDRTLVGGFAVPGLQQNLDISRDTLDLPEYVQVEADVENFKMGATATLVSSSLLNNVNADELSADDLGNSIHQLSDAMSQLIDGSSQLYEGLNELAAGNKKLADGTAELADKSASLPDSATQLADGASQLAGGLGSAVDGTDALIAGNSQVDAGLKQLKGDDKNGLTLAANSTDLLEDGAKKLGSGMELLRNGGTTEDGVETPGLAGAIQGLGDENTSGTLIGGVAQETAGLQKLQQGVGEAQAGTEQVLAGLKRLKDGADGKPGLSQASEMVKGLDLSALGDLSAATESFEQAAAQMQNVQETLNGVNTTLTETVPANITAAANAANGIGASATEARENAQTAGANAEKAGSSAQAATSAAQTLQDAASSVDTSKLSDSDATALNTALANAQEAASKAASDATSAAASADSAATSAGGAATAAGEVAKSTTSALEAVRQAAEDTGAAAKATGDAATQVGTGLRHIESASENMPDAAELQAKVKVLQEGLEKAVAALGNEDAQQTLIGGTSAINSGLANAVAGIGDESTSGTLLNGTAQLSAGLEQLSNGLQQAYDGLGDVKTDETLINGSAQLADGLSKLDEGLDKALAGIGSAGDEGTLLYGTGQIGSGLNELNSGLTSANDGANQLSGGLAQLKEAAPALLAGIQALKDGSAKLADGAATAADGSGQLASGIQQLNDEGIQKLVDAYEDNLAGLSDRLKATVQAGKDYNNFSGKNDAMRGTVKFIYETDAIEAGDE